MVTVLDDNNNKKVGPSPLDCPSAANVGKK